MVQEEGVEPTLPFGNWILSPARLPIPPLLHNLVFQTYVQTIVPD